VTSLLIEEGWAALRQGDVVAARRSFEVALLEDESGEVLDGLALTLYLECQYREAATLFERAYAAYRRNGDDRAAGFAARFVGWIRGNVLGEWAAESGWFTRALTMFEGAKDGTSAHGWALVTRAHSTREAGVREALLRDAIAIGRQLGDTDLELDALAWLGALYVMTGRTDQGLVNLDEALAGACAGEVEEVASVDSIFCIFFWACEHVNDVARADQWMRASESLMARRNVIAASCRAHYGGILTAAGRWPEAETELLAAARHFDRGRSARRDDALIRLADLRVRQGRLDEATELLVGLEQHPDVVRTIAALDLARGNVARARDLLERATTGHDDDVPRVGETTMVGPLLALLVEACLGDGDIPAAAGAADRLHAVAETQRGPYLRAAAALARGLVCIASGDGEARACLHDALEGFAAAQLPMELATAHLAMAKAASSTAPDVAVAEATAALRAFERLDAARHVDATAELLRSLGAPVRKGPRGGDTLTKRETEVLQLVAVGLSNPEIAARLHISRKTVEHHVGNVLAKLGLRNRAEAVAFAVREQAGDVAKPGDV
jgi:DNA-binding CsgD family transcriptional regulator